MTTPAPSVPPPPPPVVVRRRSDRGTLYVVIGVVVIAAVLIGVGASTGWFGLRTSSSSSCAITGGGASFVNAVMSSWTKDYQSATGNCVDYTGTSAGQGVTSLSDKLIDFAVTDEPVTSSEASALPGPILTLPVTGGPVAVVYNLPSYHQPLNLSPVQLAGIYLGTITYWNSSALTSTNPGLPTAPIVSVHRSDQAGTTYVLTNLLSIYNKTWNTTIGTTILPSPWPSSPQQQGEKGNSALAKYVAGTPNSIGYVDLPDAINNKLPTAAILNREGSYILPSIATTDAAIANLSGQTFPAASGSWSSVSWVNAPGTNSYPLATLSYILVLTDLGVGHTASCADALLVVQWLHYVLTVGQTESSAVDFVNPPANLVTQDLNALASIEYQGSPACT